MCPLQSLTRIDCRSPLSSDTADAGGRPADEPDDDLVARVLFAFFHRRHDADRQETKSTAPPRILVRRTLGRLEKEHPDRASFRKVDVLRAALIELHRAEESALSGWTDRPLFRN